MANPFMVGKDHRDIDTAILYENAIIYDIGNAVAYTDGERIVVNTEDNLTKILPSYNKDFLKWILWHEKYHINLKHHKRYFKYVKDLSAIGADKTFNVTQNEVNIIMDILVHDSLCKMFPELTEIAKTNLAQMRNGNSLGYTFETYTLEEMLDEYSQHKKGEDKTEGKGTGEGERKEDGKEEDTSKDTEDKKSEDKKEEEKSEDKKKKSHCKGGTPKKEKGKPKDEDKLKEEDTPPKDEHDKTDWSKLKNLDDKEFISTDDTQYYQEEINRLRRKKLKMGRLTQQLNGLATTKRDRTYRLPSLLQASDGCIFKGKTPGRVELYLIFDASGSMSGDMKTFKEIITKSIPQAMKCPCEWFAGWGEEVSPYKTERDDVDGCTERYFKHTYKDFMPVHASGGYRDDGDRVIDLCYQAEQKGFSPIGVTDGGGRLSWSKDKLKQLKRTVLVGQNREWLNKCREVNPHIQTLDIDMRGGE